MMVNNVTYMYGEIDDTVNIPRDEYESLLEDSAFLESLRQAGVDNWDGFDHALEIFDKFNEGVRD